MKHLQRFETLLKCGLALRIQPKLNHSLSLPHLCTCMPKALGGQMHVQLTMVSKIFAAMI
jgi:hypothetical protein